MQMLLRPGHMRLLDQHRPIARRVERPHEAPEPHGHRARDDAELALTAPLPIALGEQCFVSREAEHAPAEGKLREIAGSAAASNRRAEQHDPARR